MILRLRWGLIICVLFFTLSTKNLILAQGKAAISEVNASYVFGKTLEVSAFITSGLSFKSINFYLQPGHLASRISPVTMGSDNTLNISYNLQENPLPPFARIYFWFEVEFEDGSKETTPSYWFDYKDNRYSWKQISSRLFEVFWIEGESTFGEQVSSIAKIGLEKATKILPIAPELPIRVYVYSDVNTLQEALFLNGQEWVAGHASPEYGVILVSNNSNTDGYYELERQIPHEIMHILQYQLTGDKYNNVPAWLAEGLSTYSQTYPDPELERTLEKAATDQALIPMESLCDSFPRSAEDAQLAYAQSLSFIKFIENVFGNHIFVEMLEGSKSGATCSQLVKIATGSSLSVLENNWKSIQFPNIYTQSKIQGTLPLLAMAGICIGLIMFFSIRCFQKRKRMRIDAGR